MFTYQPDDLGVYRRPDRSHRPALVVRGVGSGHVFERNHDFDVEHLAAGDVDDFDMSGSPPVTFGVTAAEELGDCFERSLGGTETDSLGRCRRHLFEAFE